MEKYAVVEFDDYPDDWVRVRLSGVSIRAFERVVDAGNKAGITTRPAAFRELADLFAPFVDSWSFPEEPSADALLDRDMNFLLATVKAWVSGVREVPLPLPRRPSDTALSESESP